MKSIGGLLRRGRPGEQREFSAAFILGATNDALLQIVQLQPADARANSFMHGTVMIGVSHGAVAGLIQQSSVQLIEAINKKLQASGGGPETVQKIVTRPTESPLV